MKDVDGKVAFITGGDSGIGLGIAHAFANAGMKVVITYRSRTHLDAALTVLKPFYDRVHAVCLDVTDRAAMAEAAKETVRTFGKVHVLVNNAGVCPMISLTNATFDDWDWCTRVNINGVFNGIRVFLPYIREHGDGGHVVSTSSMVGGLIVGPFWGVYSATKFAVTGIMEALRSELDGTNVGASVFCPGGVESKIYSSERNRPADLGERGTPDSIQQASMNAFNKAARAAVLRGEGGEALMDPLTAGKWVLDGVLNNDLYILSHPEYEQALRDRTDLLLASNRGRQGGVSKGRAAIAEAARNRIYTAELEHQRGRKSLE